MHLESSASPDYFKKPIFKCSTMISISGLFQKKISSVQPWWWWCDADKLWHPESHQYLWIIFKKFQVYNNVSRVLGISGLFQKTNFQVCDNGDDHRHCRTTSDNDWQWRCQPMELASPDQKNQFQVYDDDGDDFVGIVTPPPATQDAFSQHPPESPDY